MLIHCNFKFHLISNIYNSRLQILLNSQLDAFIKFINLFIQIECSTSSNCTGYLLNHDVSTKQHFQLTKPFTIAYPTSYPRLSSTLTPIKLDNQLLNNHSYCWNSLHRTLRYNTSIKLFKKDLKHTFNQLTPLTLYYYHKTVDCLLAKLQFLNHIKVKIVSK